MSVIYVSEIAHSSYRQMLLSLNSVFFSIGMLFATIVGTLFQWQAVNVIFFIFTAITAILLVVVLPESPVWLAKFRVDRISDIKKSMRRIYPKNNQVTFFFILNIKNKSLLFSHSDNDPIELA